MIHSGKILLDKATLFSKLAAYVANPQTHQINVTLQRLRTTSMLHVYTYVAANVKNRSMTPEALHQAERVIRLLAQLHNSINQPQPNWQSIGQQFNQVAGEFETFKNKYMPQWWIDQNKSTVARPQTTNVPQTAGGIPQTTGTAVPTAAQVAMAMKETQDGIAYISGLLKQQPATSQQVTTPVQPQPTGQPIGMG